MFLHVTSAISACVSPNVTFVCGYLMSNNPSESLSIPCTACGVCVMECEALTCENCCAVCYCSLVCKQNNLVFGANPDHSHQIWCSKMKAFMLVESRLCELPLSFARATTQTNFSEQHFAHFLTAYGVFNTGLWKYECHSHVNVAPWDSVSTPGDELHLFSALFAVTSLDTAKETAPENPYGLTFNSTLSYEDAMLRAYVLPMEAILLSIDPIIVPFSGSSRQQLSLVSVHLPDWASYYIWRGLCSCQSTASTADLEQFNSPVAILLHWALTVYYILAYVLPKTSPQTISSVLKMGRLTIHLIGVEHELSMLPVFKELHHLVRLGLEVRLYFIGTHIDPTVNRRVFHLSDRLLAIVWAGTYHDFWGTQSNYGIDLPDVIIGLNSGLSAYASWTPTLKLIHALGVPSYFTDACLYSCAWGYKVAGYLGLGPNDYQPDLGPILDDEDGTGIHAPILNPFRSPVHLRSAGVRWGWFKNAFIFSPIRIPDFNANKDDLIEKLASLHV